MRLAFIGADHEVTGSCTYVECAGKKFLVDFGMEQGLDTLLVGGSDSIGYVAEENAIILYAYYKKFARQTLISVVDVGLSSDIATINEEDLKESMFNLQNQHMEPIIYTPDGAQELCELMGKDSTPKKNFVMNNIDFREVAFE